MQIFDMFLVRCIQTYGQSHILLYKMVLKLSKDVYLNKFLESCTFHAG